MQYTEPQREVWINARSLLLKAIDVMDKFFCVGKYKPLKEITITPSDSIAGAVVSETKDVCDTSV
jgi:hypothetical protein